MLKFDFSGKKALVTGAGQGIQVYFDGYLLISILMICLSY